MHYVMIWKYHKLNGYECAGRYASLSEAENKAKKLGYTGANGSGIAAFVWDEKTYWAWHESRD